ncbi:oligosaccharide flippase family protein [Geotalea sp. SG265]|uniref:oligosaccharide flippase family protein n=1 Tax=Geotalea sp. SG265 TaxID=2922867 RepID=UPI001FAF524B|nr:oligosaccharide flippase family protein [Geotalea sp. SG265]
MQLSWIHDARKRFDKVFPAESLRKRFTVGVSWVMSGSLFRQAASFLAGIYVARILGVADFGKLAIIQSTVLMVSNFGQAGIGLSTTKYVASTRSTDPERAGRIIGFSLTFACVSSLLAGAILVILSAPISEKLLPGGDLSMQLGIASGWIMFEIVSLLQLRMLAGLESFRGSAHVTLYQGILLLPVVVAGGFWGGLNGTIVAYSLVSLLGCVAGQIILWRECRRLHIRIAFRRLWEERCILRMSTMVWLSAIALNVTNWLVGILLARQPGGVTEFALFNAASRFQNVLVFLPTRVFHVSVPVLANLQAEGSRRRFARVLLCAGGITMGVTVTGALLFMLFSDQLMSWYGKDFAQGGKVLGMVAVLCIVSSLWTIATAGLWAAEQSRQMLFLDIFRGFLLISLCLAGPVATAQGLALAHVISYGAGVILLLLVLYRYLRQPWPAREVVSRKEQQEVAS